MSDPLELKLNMGGETWEVSQPIRTVGQTLLDLDTLVEKAYLTLEGKTKRHGREERQCSLFATDYRVGSFEADLVLVIGQSMLALQPNDIWELVKNGIEFAGAYFDLFSKEEAPTIKSGNGDNIIINGDNNVINVSKDIITFVSRSDKEFKSLGGMLLKGDMSSINLSTAKNGKIHVDKKVGKTLGNPLAMQRLRDISNKINPNLLETSNTVVFVPFKNVITVKGNIFEFNKKTGCGSVEITENSIISSGEYDFEIKNFVPTNDVISAMHQRTVDLEVEGIFTRGSRFPEKLLLRNILEGEAGSG